MTARVSLVLLALALALLSSAAVASTVRGTLHLPPGAQTVSPVVQVIPADWGKGLEKLFESGEWKGPALAIGGVWLVLKLTELRRLRRLTRAMMAGR